MNSITETSSITMADRIRQLRKEHGLTQEDLAAKAGLGVASRCISALIPNCSGTTPL